jgi:Protein of unknown function (DUF3037)
VPDLHSFDYAAIRVVPRVDREEFMNVGVILFSATKPFLGVRTHIDETRLTSFCGDIDCRVVKERLEAFSRVSSGDPAGGVIAALSHRQRFHWLTAPRSTIIQVSPVHCGVCESPERMLDNLFRRLVL